MIEAVTAIIAGGAVTNDRTTRGVAAADIKAARRRIGAVAQAAAAVPVSALAAFAVPAAVAALAVATVQAKSATAEMT